MGRETRQRAGKRRAGDPKCRCRRFERVPEPTGRLGNFAGQDVAPYVACGTSYRGAFLRWTFSSGGALNSWQKSVEVTQCQCGGGGERAMGEARLADDCSANKNVHVDWGILGGTCTVATGVRWESSSLKVVRGGSVHEGRLTGIMAYPMSPRALLPHVASYSLWKPV